MAEQDKLWQQGKHGEAAAHWKLVEYAYDIRDWELALKNLEELCVRYYDKKAMYMYFTTATSDAVIYNKYQEKARERLIMAADGGDELAEITLAGAYVDGEYGFNKDIGMARKWYSRAAASGSHAAKYYLCKLDKNEDCK